ncbi:hypothetical protein T09_2927 [Trichinella sp. T9]|nr:hypothetical protein T09_2927 [Trichinella sp. T9]
MPLADAFQFLHLHFQSRTADFDPFLHYRNSHSRHFGNTYFSGSEDQNVSDKTVVACKLVDCNFYSAAGQINNDYLTAIRATFVSKCYRKQHKSLENDFTKRSVADADRANNSIPPDNEAEEK